MSGSQSKRRQGIEISRLVYRGRGGGAADPVGPSLTPYRSLYRSLHQDSGVLENKRTQGRGWLKGDHSTQAGLLSDLGLPRQLP